VSRRQRVVVPGDDDRGRALGERSRLADDRNEIARLVEFGEELEASFAGLGASHVARRWREASGINALDGLVGGARVTGESDRCWHSRLQQVGPILRAFLDDVLVHQEGQHAVIVAVPVAFGILGAVRDRIPGRDLVGLDQAFGLGGRAEGEADVDHVRSLRALVVLVGLDGFDFVARAGVGVEFVDGEAVLGLEAFDDAAVAAPVVRQGDGGQLAFFLAAAISSSLGSAAAMAVDAMTMAVESESRRRIVKSLVFSLWLYQSTSMKLILGSDEAYVTLSPLRPDVRRRNTFISFSK
jgi:hypothetical protein